MIVYFMLLIEIFINTVSCSLTNYCKSSICDDTKKHTLCQFQLPGPSPHCINYEKILKEADKRDILDKINSRRNKVAAGEIRSLPPAQDMLKLEWNEELEMAAQRWADQCVAQGPQEETDSCRDLGKIPQKICQSRKFLHLRDKYVEVSSGENGVLFVTASHVQAEIKVMKPVEDGVHVGQNVATIYGESPGLTPSVLVDLWYMELLNLNASVISNYYPSSMTDLEHYDFFTQMVWAETSSVGCGGVKFQERAQEFDTIKNRTVYRLVCNFAVSGNQIGEPVYAAGISCTRCPRSFVCHRDYTALCTFPITPIEKINQYESINHDNSDYSKLEPNTITTSVMSFHNENIKTMNNINNISQINDTNDSNFDLMSHLFQFTITIPHETTPSTAKCKDVIAVDEFIDILKRKLNNEQILRELLFSSKSLNEDEISDATVAAIVRKLYSESVPSTTSITTQNENINSTLLADLVEAVIFRQSDRYTSTESSRISTNIISEVSAIKISAELGEIKSNKEFTGHYFFPEEGSEEDDSQSESESTESYYDTSNFPLSEIIYEIEDLKRKQVTKDFLEEILESDSESVPVFDNLKKDEVVSNLSTSGDDDDSPLTDKETSTDSKLKQLKRTVRSCKFSKHKSKNKENTLTKYNLLLQNLANDIRLLKLNERFSCCFNKGSNVVLKMLNLLLSLLIIKML